MGRTAGLPQLHGLDSLTGTPNFFWPTRRKRRATASSARSASSRCAGRPRPPTSCCSRRGLERPTTSGAAEEPGNPNDLVQMVYLTQTIAPGVVDAMKYRSQYWLNNKTSGTTGMRPPRTSPGRTA